MGDASAVMWLFCRLMGVIYLVAFLSLYVQLPGLYSSKGILPIAEEAKAALEWRGRRAFRHFPSLFLWRYDDRFIFGCAVAGIVSSLCLAGGVLPPLAALACWLLYLSFVTMGREFLSYQWDVLLLEAGLMTFFAETLGASSPVAVFAFRFFLFRFMFSSGMVKITSGDPAWRRFEAMRYHYETQPLPNRIAWYAHTLRPWMQKLSTVGTFVAEVGIPFLAFGTGQLRLIGFLLLAGFQLIIMATGSYGFFNLLTIVLCLPLLDDRMLPRFLPQLSGGWETAQAVIFGIFILLNLFQLVRLFARPRWMSALLRPLQPFMISNPYGLFAVMTTRRYELVIEGSDDRREWLEYDFRWKPGNPQAPPRQAAPHQPRLDWQMWFAALEPLRLQPWVTELAGRILEGSPPVLRLLAKNPFPERPPAYLRIAAWRYRFTTRAERRESGAWWHRELVGIFPPLALREQGESEGA